MPPVAFFSHGAVYTHNPRGAAARVQSAGPAAAANRPTRPNRERSNRTAPNGTPQRTRSSESSGPDTRPPRRGGTGRLERVPCEPERVSLRSVELEPE